jgi:2-dehydro-3-deoxy-D-gluconate 5-dehydrogenase
MPPSSPFDLSGKVALVTGGNGGIGLGIARGLAAAG